MNTKAISGVVLPAGCTLAACSGDGSGAEPSPAADGGADAGAANDSAAGDSAADASPDINTGGDGQSYEACMRAICNADPEGVCCCIPMTMELVETEACAYEYPTEVPTEFGPVTPPPKLVAILVGDENGNDTGLPWVSDEAQCSGGGFYYEHEEGDTVPARIHLCPDSCTAAAGTIVFQSGCHAMLCC
ncbi:MAG: hypothetical protein ACOC1F_10430 [Myxococcota bacterium]